MDQKWTSVIEGISFVKYRSFTNNEFRFTPTVNLISGTNGTGKSTLLHVIGNAFQKVVPSCPWMVDSFGTRELRSSSALLNPKIESLLRGSKYADPAEDVKGNLFSVTYRGGQSLSFRRHNSKNIDRNSVKPQYSGGRTRKLPSTPVLYLGLSRLIPYAEFEGKVTGDLGKALNSERIESLRENYKKLVGLDIDPELISIESTNGIKSRGSFLTDNQGIDSNTISAGQDNVFILLHSLELLRTYAELTENSPSLLLVDEIESTLHPTLQMKLYELLLDYSKRFKIQIIMTTHSIDLLEYALRAKQNVIYLRKGPKGVECLPEPTPVSIRMSLRTETMNDLLPDRKIFIFTEDKEARLLVDKMFRKIEAIDPSFSRVRSRFHLLDVNIGGDQIKSLFKEGSLRSTVPLMAILDGDKGDSAATPDFTHSLAYLPGGDSPEKFLFDYAAELYEKDSDFWRISPCVDVGFGAEYFDVTIRQDWEGLQKANNTKQRVALKAHFNQFQEFYLDVWDYWLNSPENGSKIVNFRDALFTMFRKTAPLAGLPTELWSKRRS